MVTGDGSKAATYMGAFLYFADLEGKVWKLNLTDQGTFWELEQVFDSEADNVNGRMAYFPVTAAQGKDQILRLFLGTGDQQRLMSGDLNIDNRVYSIKESKFPSPGLSDVSAASEERLLDVTANASACSASDDLGWKVRLKPGEKVTSQVRVNYGTAFYSTYLPLTTDECALGTTRFTGVDFECGSRNFSFDLGSGLATVPVLYLGKIYMGISGNGDEFIDFKLPEGWKRVGNLVAGEPLGAEGKSWKFRGVQVESWFEEY